MPTGANLSELFYDDVMCKNRFDGLNLKFMSVNNSFFAKLIEI